MTKRESDKLENIILQRLGEMEKKLDAILETAIPNLRIESAVMKERAGKFAMIVSAIGGALAVLTSAAVAMWFK